MSETVGIVVATFGDSKWKKTAEKALASARKQTRPADDVVYLHYDDPNYPLGYVRNEAAADLDTDWVVFLDADDELDPKYIEEMLKGSGDVRQPSTLGIYPDGSEDTEAVLIPEKSFLDGNYIVIGAFVNRRLFSRAGGFREFPLYEDWDLWLRMEEHGAVFGKCPDAIYRVHVNPGSRNLPSRVIQERYYHTIRGQALHRRGL